MMIGQTISHYKILEKLGEGGMGVVYKAEDTRLKRTVALKFLSATLTADPEARKRFVHEAQATSALDHSNICIVHDVGEADDGSSFIVMTCYEGETLKKRLERGPLEIDLAMDIAIQVASGLVRAHEAGIIHRDIKPANIMLTSRNEPKILDFGLARLSHESVLTKSGTTMGTAAYMSPEQARAEQVDHRADIWALGTVLYELLAGQRAFQSDYAQALVYSILNEEPKSLRTIRPEVPEAVEQIIRKAMAKHPNDRYQTARELLADLTVARGRQESGGTIAAAELFERKRRKKLLRWMAAAGLAVLVVTAGIFVGLPFIRDQALASDPKTITVIGFENLTGDKSLDKHRLVLLDAIITSLEQSKYMRVTPRQRINDILKQLGKKDVETVDNELGLVICRREGAELMALGTYASVGELYRTTLKLIDVKTQETVNSFKAEGKGEESLLTQVDDLSREVSRGIGVSERRTNQTIKSVADISTSSMEAYGLYVRGEQENERLAWTDARRYLELAVQKDSQYAIAWWRLGYTLSWLGDSRGADSAIKKSASLAWRASEKEQWAIAADDSLVRANILGLPNLSYIDFLKLRAERYPREKEFLAEYGNSLWLNMHKPTEAIPVLQKALELDPMYTPALNSLAFAYSRAGDVMKSLEILKRYMAAAPGDPIPYDSMGNILDGQGRYEEAEQYYKQALAVAPGFGPSMWGLIMGKMRREDYAAILQMMDTTDVKGASYGYMRAQLYGRACIAFWTGQLNEADRFLAKLEALRLKNGQPPDHGYDWLKIWIAYERRQFAESHRALNLWKVTYLPVDLSTDQQLNRLRSLFVELCRGFISLKEGGADSVTASLARMDSIHAQIPRSDTSQPAKEANLGYRVYSQLLRSEWLLSSGHSQEALSVRPKDGARAAASGPYRVTSTGLAGWASFPCP